MDAVEMWACEGAAHSRPVQEHGAGDEPEDLATAFLLAGAKRVLGARWPVPAVAAALLMERFALRVAQGESDSRALRGARADLRAALASGGVVEDALRRELSARLDAASVDGGEMTREVVRDCMMQSRHFAIEELRRGWYDTLAAPPVEYPRDLSVLALMVDVEAPYHERLRDALESDPAGLVDTIAQSALRWLRSDLCWFAWRVTCRDLGDVA